MRPNECQDINQGVELIVRAQSDALWAACKSPSNTNNDEYGFIIYRDGPTLRTTEIFPGNGAQIAFNPSAYGVSWAEVEAVVHCHPVGNIGNNSGDLAALNQMLHFPNANPNMRSAIVYDRSSDGDPDFDTPMQLNECPTDTE